MMWLWYIIKIFTSSRIIDNFFVTHADMIMAIREFKVLIIVMIQTVNKGTAKPSHI